MIGKLSQAVVVAGAAYRSQEDFRHLTGMTASEMVVDSGAWDTQASCDLHLRFRLALRFKLW